MRVLLDENLPVDFASQIHGHSVDTVAGIGWAGMQNGELLRRIGGHYDALVTMDGNLKFQQAVGRLSFGVIVIRAASNRLLHLQPLVPQILAALEILGPGEIREVA